MSNYQKTCILGMVGETIKNAIRIVSMLHDRSYGRSIVDELADEEFLSKISSVIIRECDDDDVALLMELLEEVETVTKKL